MSEIADYILKEYDGYVIRGEYNPSQLSTDRENGIERKKEELEQASKSFYSKNGYSIIHYDEFLKDKTSIHF